MIINADGVGNIIEITGLDKGCKIISMKLAGKIRKLLPSRQYLKAYMAMLLVIYLALGGISLLLSSFVETEIALTGAAIIALMVGYDFAGVLIAGILLNIFDREK